MKKKLIFEQKGIALIVTLLTAVLISVLVLEFAQTAKVDLEISKNFKDQLDSYAIARSGVEFARYALKNDKVEVDNLKEDWAKDYSKILAAVMFKKGTFKLTITDESSKINVNNVVLQHGTPTERMYPPVVGSLKNLCDVTSQDYKFVDAIIDWIDTDDKPTMFADQQESGGAEDNEYKQMTPPYNCKNAPLDTIRELFIVKGFTEETYFGTPEDDENAEIHRTGLKDFITVYGEDKNPTININTAPKEVIRALDIEISEEIANNIIKTRDESPFESVDDFKNRSLVSDAIFNRINKNGNCKINIRSAGYFSIHSIGTVNNITTEINAVLNRALNGEIFVVYWQVL